MNENMHVNNNYLIKLFIALSILTTSFDIFLNIDLFGYNIRFTLIIIIPVVLFYAASIFKNGKMILPMGGSYLLIFLLIQFIFISRSPDFTNALQYALYLTLEILIIFSVSYFCNKAYSFDWLIKIYLNSYFYIAVFGLIQFVLYMFNINLLVRQSWTNLLARINGFSYEPSYFATYMLMGFVSYAYLLEKKYTKATDAMILKFIVIFLAMILSTSRMGWIMMAMYIIVRVLNILKMISTHNITKKTLINFSLFMCILIIIVAFGVKYIIQNASRFLFLLNGLGIGGMSAHSANDRINGLITCISIWRESPFLGYSLGGVDPIICQFKGTTYISGNNGASMSIIGEILVACGLIGLIPFICYIKSIIFSSVKPNNDKMLHINYAFVLALIFEFAILCMNQNILRPYLWIHIAVLSCCYKSENIFLL